MIENHHARPALGATPLPGGGWNFTVWAPRHERVELHLLNTGAAFPMERDALGYHGVIAETFRPARNICTGLEIRRNARIPRRAASRMEFTDLRTGRLAILRMDGPQLERFGAGGQRLL